MNTIHSFILNFTQKAYIFSHFDVQKHRFLLENRYISSLTFEGRSLYIETLEAHLVIGLF